MSNYHQYTCMCLHQYLHLKFNDNSNCDFFKIIYRVRAMVFNATFNQQYFSYIVALSFTGGGNRSTRRKPTTCRKSLTKFIT